MSVNTPKPPIAGKPVTAPTTRREPPVMNNNTGRVKHDERGNAIWEWAISTGSMVVESATQRLKKLDNPTLSLVDDGRSTGGLSKEKPRSTVSGYSPYDSGLLAKGKAARKTDLRRLSEWLKLKKQAGSNTPDKE